MALNKGRWILDRVSQPRCQAVVYRNVPGPGSGRDEFSDTAHIRDVASPAFCYQSLMISDSTQTFLIIAVFAVTYIGMALGRVPGLRLGRTGVALLAVVVLLAFGGLDVEALWRAQDAPTLLMLFALMILSGQLGAAGFYDLCARRITLTAASPSVILFITVIVSGVLSAVLANDIVVFAMTPMLCRGLAARGLDARPFLLGLAGGSNAGSAATLIGNPQNILIGEAGALDFWHFLAVCGPPAGIALVLVFISVRIVWRAELAVSSTVPAALPMPDADNGQIVRGLLAVLVLIGLFATPLPRAASALALAALLLLSRGKQSRALFSAVDGNLLVLFACLFAVTAAFAGTGLGADALAWLAGIGLLPDSLQVMAPLALVLSNGIGNVPAVILIIAVWPDASSGALYGLALLSTLAGNLFLVGSMANLIVAERAKAAGVRISFADFAKAGVPMTLASMAVAVLWLWAGGWLAWSH